MNEPPEYPEDWELTDTEDWELGLDEDPLTLRDAAQRDETIDEGLMPFDGPVPVLPQDVRMGEATTSVTRQQRIVDLVWDFRFIGVTALVMLLLVIASILFPGLVPWLSSLIHH